MIGLLGVCHFYCSRSPSDDETIANVGGRKITVKKFREDFELAPKYVRSKKGTEAARQHLEAMIEKELLVLEAERRNLDKDEKIQTRLKWVERTTVRDQFYKERIREKVEITDAELREAFVKYNKSIRARHLFAPSEEEAYALLKRIRDGEDFAELAKECFSDSQLARSGGDLGYFTFGDSDEAFEKAAFDLDVGEISQPVATRWGYHIIKIEDIKRNVLVTEDDFALKRPALSTLIRKRKEKALADQFVHDFMTAKNIRVHKDAFLLIFEQCQSLANGREARLPPYIPVLGEVEINRLDRNLQVYRDDILLEFDGGSWSIGDFVEKLSQMPLIQRPKLSSLKRFRDDLAGMLRDELLSQEGYRQNLHDTPRVREEVNTWRDEILSLGMKSTVASEVIVSDQEIREFYKSHSYNYTRPREVKIQEILVESKALADDLLRRAKAGEDMAALARQYSLRKETAKHGGELGYFSRGSYGKIGQIAFGLRLGEFSVPVELERKRYCILRVIGHKGKEVEDLEKVEDRVREDLIRHIKSASYLAFLEELKDTTTISVDDDLLRKTADHLEFKHRIGFVQTRKYHE